MAFSAVQPVSGTMLPFLDTGGLLTRLKCGRGSRRGPLGRGTASSNSASLVLTRAPGGTSQGRHALRPTLAASSFTLPP
eukprot:1592181-Heterocapsa_arctica.AAC.1